MADLDGPPDLLIAMLFSSIGVGLLATKLTPRRQRHVLIVVTAAVLCNAIVVASGHPLAPTYLPTAAGVPPFEHIDPMLFWTEQLPDSCHLRLSGVEQQWIADSQRSGCRG